MHFGHTLHAAPPPSDADAAGRRALYLSYVPPLTFEMIGPGTGLQRRAVHPERRAHSSTSTISTLRLLGPTERPGLQSRPTWWPTRDRPAPAREPAWMPAYVGSAYRRGDRDGRRPALRRRSRSTPRGPQKGGGGFPLRKALHEGSSTRRRGTAICSCSSRSGSTRHSGSSDPYEPRLAPANVDNVLKWGMDCPDAAYKGAAIRGDAYYVVRGNRQTVRYLGFQAMVGNREHRQHRRRRAASRIRRLLRARARRRTARRRRAGELDAADRADVVSGGSPVLLRLGERESRRPRDRMRSRSNRRSERTGLSAAGVANQLAALGEFVDASFTFWQRRRRRRPRAGSQRLQAARGVYQHGGRGGERLGLGILAA